MSEAATLRRYTEEEDNLILSCWFDKKRRPELAEKLDRPLGGLNYRFYQILKERNLNPKEYRKLARKGQLEQVVAEERTVSKPEIIEDGVSKESGNEDSLLEALKYFPERARQIEAELEWVKKELNRIREERFSGLPDFLSGFKKLDEVKAENLRLKEQIEKLNAENQSLMEQTKIERKKLDEDRRELREVYDDLEAMFSEFMRLSSVDKIRVLGDFASRLEVTVDKFGNVVKLKRTL